MTLKQKFEFNVHKYYFVIKHKKVFLALKLVNKAKKKYKKSYKFLEKVFISFIPQIS